MLLAFRNKYENARQQVQGTAAIILQDTVPVSKKNTKKIPEEISSIGLFENQEDAGISDPIKNKLHGLVGVKRKDGKIEVYDLDSKENRDAFEKKYGVKLEDLITPPPPTPPVPAVEAVPGITPVPPVPPVPPVQSKDGITPKAVTVGNEIDLSGVSSEYEITDKKAVIKLKDGTVEKYDLTNKQERAAFEKKYGRIININTHVNASVNVAPVATVVNGTTLTSTVAPAKIVTNPITTAVVAPSKISGNLSALAVTPAAIRNGVPGTTVIAPMAATEGVTIIDDYGYTITGNEDILVTITKHTTRQQLDDFIKQMKAKDIELSYDNIEYNSKGELIALSGTMRSKDGRSNFVASDFEKLILAMIRNGEKTWFKVSVKDKEVI